VLISILGQPTWLNTIQVSARDPGKDKWTALVTMNSLNVVFKGFDELRQITEYSLLDVKDLASRSHLSYLSYNYIYYADNRYNGIIHTSSNNSGFIYVLATKSGANDSSLTLLILKTG